MEWARALVEPIVRQRELDAKGAALTAKSNDTVQWLSDLLPGSDKQNYTLQGALQLAITTVSVQSTSKLMVNIVLNLIQHPECAEMLKEEAESVLEQCSGVWTLSSMERLEKLDSFMRESLRFEPPLTGKPDPTSLSLRCMWLL